jgi:hypothetical protein
VSDIFTGAAAFHQHHLQQPFQLLVSKWFEEDIINAGLVHTVDIVIQGVASDAND